METPKGCTAWIIEPINESLEDNYGAIISDMIGRQFQKARVMMIKV